MRSRRRTWQPAGRVAAWSGSCRCHPAGPPISMAHPGDAAGHQGALTMAGGVTGRLRPRSAAAPRSCLVREPEWRPGGRCRNRETSKPGALTKLSHQRCRIATGMQRLIRRGGQKSREIEAVTRLMGRPHQPCDRHAPPRDLHCFPRSTVSSSAESWAYCKQKPAARAWATLMLCMALIPGGHRTILWRRREGGSPQRSDHAICRGSQLQACSLLTI